MTSAGMMASVSGILIFRVVPRPTLESMSSRPLIFSTLVLTTSMPTPRPLMLVTAAAVENPGRKTRSSASRSDIFTAWSWEIRPFSTALALTLSGSMPAPSSRISMWTWPSSWKARSSNLPSGALPLAMRSAGASMPWSTELRTMWVSGSVIDSMRLRSSSVSAPSSSSRTLLPQAADTSRTRRGNRFHAEPIGCIRVVITRACSSVVIRSRRWAAAAIGVR